MATLLPSTSRVRVAAAVAGATLLAAACSGGGSGGSAATTIADPSRPHAGSLPTIAGGIELTKVEPNALLVGEGLTFGQPLPSEQAAADAFREDPEVASAVARRVFSASNARLVARVAVLVLDGKEIFDEDVLAGFVRGAVGASGGGPVQDVAVGTHPALRSVGPAGAAAGYLEGDLVVIVTAPTIVDAQLVVERQLAARAAGVVGGPEPVTPMPRLAIDAAFVAVPTVTFQAIPPPEEELPPAPPTFPGVTAVQGRYGVVAGERRTVVWAFTVDPATYPSAERLEPAMAALASARAGGAPAGPTEVVDRVVQGADPAPDAEGAMAARVFRRGALVLLVEGRDPAQVDAVVADWITALAGG